MKHSEFVEYVLDMLEPLNPRARAMFGGWGLYARETFIGIVADDELYFKVDTSNRAEYESRGSRAFVYEGHKNKKITMSYWIVPPHALEDRDELIRLAELSLAINKAKKKPAPRQVRKVKPSRKTYSKQT